MSLALKALSSARKLMQNAWISISSIQLIPSGVAKQFSTFSFQHGACRNKMSGSSSAAPQSLQGGPPCD